MGHKESNQTNKQIIMHIPKCVMGATPMTCPNMTEQHDSDVKHQTNKTAANHFGESASVWKGVYCLEIMIRGQKHFNIALVLQEE